MAAPLQADPFAAAPSNAPREVRLVIDDKAVSDAEVGRQGGGKFAIAAVVVGLVGVAVGWFVGSTARERQLYDRVLQDAKEIYDTTSKAAPAVEKAQKLIDQAVKAAAPGGGKGVTVDFKALEDLRALPKPFPADVFSRKLYGAFESSTVDSLFMYYNQTNQLWAKIGAIAARSLAPAAREGLTKAAASAGQYANNDYGCVPFKDGDNFACGLVTVNREDSKDGKTVKVAVRGQSADKTVFSGQDIGTKTSDFVIIVDKGRSNDILGAAKNQFDGYARDLMEAKTLADQTLEIQGRLVQQLGEIAKLETLN